jgi:hypothetical protein
LLECLLECPSDQGREKASEHGDEKELLLFRMLWIIGVCSKRITSMWYSWHKP